MLRASRFILPNNFLRLLPVTSAGTKLARFAVKAKGKTKQHGGKQKRRPQVARKNRSASRSIKSKAQLDHVIGQSQDVLSLARPFSVYHPPPHITPEIADDIVLYKDGKCLSLAN